MSSTEGNGKKSVPEKSGQENDSVRISPDVIGIVAGIAAQEVKGVAGMSGGIVDGIAQRLGRKDFSKGIKVSLDQETVSLELTVVVDYGVKIMETATVLKQKVRNTVEEITGLAVASIKVHVVGINLAKEQAGDSPSQEETDEN
ncbi:MAG: Asp23/Gls24 family envelope stress response protein [Firmicutes bacterium]|nr:Asp23/Gls24 family envelope stress response protein [Bacillota bacterium]